MNDEAAQARDLETDGASEALMTVGVLSDTHGHLYAEVKRVATALALRY